MRKGLLLATVVAIALFTTAAVEAAGVVWLETERFDKPGGWINDSQFIDQMGSPYLLANGLGTPVDDAVTTIAVPAAGKYRLWVRTKDWMPDHHPGRFQVVLGGKTIEPTFGQSGRPGWRWEDGGVHHLAGKVEIRLHDLTGYYGRCDAIVLSGDLDFVPPVDKDAVAALRETHGGVSRRVEDVAEHDVVVVGGGLAGCMAAVAAARNGAATALVQNRPVLGGNASVEILVPPVGAGGRIRESGLIEEVRTAGNQRAAESWVYSGRLRRLVDAEPNLDLFLNTHATGVEMKDGSPGMIGAVLAVNTRSGNRMRLAGRVFIDCTGDGAIGIWAGADYRHGREPKSVHQESLAPEQGNRHTMGNSLKYAARRTDSPKPLVTPPWAFHFPKCSDFGPQRHPWLDSSLDWQWKIEWGGTRDTYHDAEEIRDDLLRIIYGMWDHVKNHCPKQKDQAADCELAWVGYVAGKRESNRLVGDYVMTEQDFTGQMLFPDRIAYGGWGLDDHTPAGFFGKENPSHHPFRGRPHSVPYRSIYSKNVDNLLMAGRNISVTHVALGTTRVMLTCGVIGHAAGTAAGMCIERDTMPRGVYQDHLKALQQRLLKEGAYLISLAGCDPGDLARSAEVTASSEGSPAPAVIDGTSRPEGNESHAWAPESDADGPHWICLTWEKPQTLNTVHVTQAGNCPLVVEVWQDDRWKQVAQVADSRLRRNVLSFDAVSTTMLRVMLAERTGIHEIRVYHEPKRLVEIARRAYTNARLPDTGPGFPWGDAAVLQVGTASPAARRVTGLDPRKLPGMVFDAREADRTGTWTPSTHTGPFLGDGYLTDDNKAQGQKSVRFALKLAKPGKYEVRLAYSALANRASNTPVTIHYAGGDETLRIDQRKKAPIDGLFLPLGTFDLDEKSSVVVTNADANGYVVIDAVQLLPALTDDSISIEGPVFEPQRGVWRFTVTSPFQQGPNHVEVLMPERYDRTERHRVLYVLPVEPGIGGRYGDGMLEVKKIDAHNRHGLICVAPAFDSVPWSMDHATDPQRRHEAYLLQVVIPMIDRMYSTAAAAKGRLLLGFSKSGWGAFTLMLRNPDVFGYAASWDAPLMLQEQDWENWGISQAAGTVENFQKYQPVRLLRARAEQFRDHARFALLGHKDFGTHGGSSYTGANAHTIGTHELMESLEIRHVYNNEVIVKHAWNTGWVEPAVAALVSLAEPSK